MLATRTPAASGPEPDGEVGRDAEVIPSPGGEERDLGAGLLRLAEEIELQAELFPETAARRRRGVVPTSDVAGDDPGGVALPLDRIRSRPAGAPTDVRVWVAAAIVVAFVGMFALVQVVADDSSDSPLAQTALVETTGEATSGDVAGVADPGSPGFETADPEDDGPGGAGVADQPDEAAESDEQAEAGDGAETSADDVVTGSPPDCSKGALIAAIDSMIDGRPVATVDFTCDAGFGLARYRTVDAPIDEIHVAFVRSGSVWQARHFGLALDCDAIRADVDEFPIGLCEDLTP